MAQFVPQTLFFVNNLPKEKVWWAANAVNSKFKTNCIVVPVDGGFEIRITAPMRPAGFRSAADFVCGYVTAIREQAGA